MYRCCGLGLQILPLSLAESGDALQKVQLV